MRPIAALFISLLLGGCSSATVSMYEELPDDVVEQGLVSIEYLKSLSTGRSTVIDKDIMIEGFVVGNDFRNEFYKKIVVDDGKGGIEVEIDRLRLYQVIPLHTYVYISCNGLAIGRTGSKFTLGAPPAGEYAVDRIASADITRYIKISDDYMLPEPPEVRIDELAVEHISRYVSIRNLKVVPQEAGMMWCDAEEASDDGEEDVEDERFLTYTDRHFEDAQGNIITVRTLDCCYYAGELLPAYEVSLTGIVDYVDDMYIMRISNHRIIAEEEQ